MAFGTLAWPPKGALFLGPGWRSSSRKYSRRANTKELVVERSFHQVTKDVERGVVFAAVLGLCGGVATMAGAAAAC